MSAREKLISHVNIIHFQYDCFHNFSRGVADGDVACYIDTSSNLHHIGKRQRSMKKYVHLSPKPISSNIVE